MFPTRVHDIIQKNKATESILCRYHHQCVLLKMFLGTVSNHMDVYNNLHVRNHGGPGPQVQLFLFIMVSL